MSLTQAYSNNYGQLKEFFDKIREGQAPDKFTTAHLKDLGFTSSHHRTYIPILKGLGFLTSDGTPTQSYLDYMDKSQSKQILAQAVRNAYKPIFTIKSSPTKSDKDAIEGKFKSTFNSTDSVAKNRANTFFALWELCEHSVLPSKINPKKDIDDEDDDQAEEHKEEKLREVKRQKGSSGLGLHYNIQIHLPPTKDIEVYNAIFKSIKEHLFD